MKAEKIARYSTHGKHKSAIADRFNRSLKKRMWHRFTAENTRNWIDMLDDSVSKNKNSYHEAIRMRPFDASKIGSKSEIWENLFRDNEQVTKSYKFKISDTVRISRIRSNFEHGFLPNWTEQIYKIHKINKSEPVTYILKH